MVLEYLAQSILSAARPKQFLIREKRFLWDVVGGGHSHTLSQKKIVPLVTNAYTHTHIHIHYPTTKDHIISLSSVFSFIIIVILMSTFPSSFHGKNGFSQATNDDDDDKDIIGGDVSNSSSTTTTTTTTTDGSMATSTRPVLSASSSSLSAPPLPLSNEQAAAQRLPPPPPVAVVDVPEQKQPWAEQVKRTSKPVRRFLIKNLTTVLHAGIFWQS